MRYISTRGQAPELSFEEAMMTGLARDGGLYVPKDIPTLTAAEIAGMAGDSYEEIAYKVMRPFIGETFTDAEFRQLIAAAYAGFGHAARAPLVQLGPNHFLLELFHGPTLAFKDFAMQLIGQMMQASLTKSGKKWREPIQRYKGLGEMDAEQLRETTMDPEKRTLRRITIKDGVHAEKIFELLMGNEVAPRRDFIGTNQIDLERIDL